MSVVEPCMHCGTELYDRVAWDDDRSMAICPMCERCVEMGCPCDQAQAMRNRILREAGYACDYRGINSEPCGRTDSHEHILG